MSIQTVNFKTRTIFNNRENPCRNEKVFPLALDIGYSAVKGFSPNKVFSFPSYAIRMSEDILSLGTPSKNDIQYKDESGLWYVGELAQMMTDKSDTSENINTLYGRNRYNSPMFKIIARTGFGIGLLANEYGSYEGRKIVLQTGLPPSYAKTDSPILKGVLKGKHKFEIKIGTGSWCKFEFELSEENINIMPQPLGSIVSLTVDSRGRQIPEREKYLNNNVNMLIDDAGFGTDDFFNIRNGRNIKGEGTKDEFGMKRVMQETTNEIYKRYGVEIPVHAIQKYLQKGTFYKFIPEDMAQDEISFADILDEMSRKVCMESIEYMKSTFNYLQDYQYLVVTGGTGAAWFDIIKNYFANMKTLQVIGANTQDKLPHIFSNVRGYYFYLNGRL